MSRAKVTAKGNTSSASASASLCDGTIFPAPPPDPSKSATENLFALTSLETDTNRRSGGGVVASFTNSRRLLHSPGVRGMYGGTLVAQCLHAARRTLAPDQHPGFFPHSFHGSFIRAGQGSVPVVYEVEKLFDGRNFAARRVTAKQNQLVVFVANISLTRSPSSSSSSPKPSDGSFGGIAAPAKKGFDHEPMRPGNIPAVPPVAPPGGIEKIGRWPEEDILQLPLAAVQNGLDSKNPPSKQKIYRYIRTSPRISHEGGMHEHLAALAFLSDGTFLPDTVLISHVNGDPRSSTDVHERLRNRGFIGMCVSLDHTVYFHRAAGFRADDWMLVERSSAWVGNERAVVTARIWGQDGRLIATCVQEVSLPLLRTCFHLLMANRLAFFCSYQGLLRLRKDGAKL